MEKFDESITPIISERNLTDSPEADYKKRELLSGEIDQTAEILQEFAVPDFERQTNQDFQMYDNTYTRGSLHCNYENGRMTEATIELVGRSDSFDATLSYSQDNDAWMLETIESEYARPVPTLAIMRAITPPTLQSEFLKNARPDEVSYDDLIETFATKTKGYVDVKTYIHSSTDIDSIDSFGETLTVLEVSSSLDRKKDYKTLTVRHQTVDMSDIETSSAENDREYSITVGKNRTSYKDLGMTIEEAKSHLEELKDSKNFADLSNL